MASVLLSRGNDVGDLDEEGGHYNALAASADSKELAGEDICRVCRGSSRLGRHLYHPCLCTGSIKYVHQDCLVQWLKHSGKKVCELCHHQFKFAPVYRPDMPQRLSLVDLSIGVVKNCFSIIRHWVHLCFVGLMWLFVVPTFIYRLFKFLMYGSLWSIQRLPLHILDLNDLFLDCVYGIFIVLVSLITFVSVVWLKDQLGHGIGRNWFDEDLLDDNQVVDGNAEDAARGLRHERATETSAAAASGGPSPLSIFLRSQVDLLGEVQDTTIKERLQELWRCEVEIMHRLGLECLEYQDVLVSARRKVYNGLQVWRGALSPMAGESVTSTHPNYDDLGLSYEERVMLVTYDTPRRQLFAMETAQLLEELKSIRLRKSNIMEAAQSHLGQLCKCLSVGSTSMHHDHSARRESLNTDGVNSAERNTILQIVKLKEHVKRGDEAMQPEQDKIGFPIWHRLRMQNRQPELGQGPVARRPRPNNRHPNIGHAIAGLAREGNGLDFDDVEELTWARLLGLDGSFRFLEHVFWLICLNSVLIITFVYLPFQLGYFAVAIFPALSPLKVVSWTGMVCVFIGYANIGICVLSIYYCTGKLNVPKMKRTLATIIITIKVGMILVIEAGVFPLMCGWWIDICSFGLFDSSLLLRQKTMANASGTVMFLHWLAGILFIFYLASFVMLLREVIRPGVLWFLRNLSDQNFHPINEMINLPFQRHMRRFIMSCVLFGVCIVVLLLIPSTIIKATSSSFLPYKLSLSSSALYPLREVHVELVLLQFIIPVLLEHGNCKAALKALIKFCSTFSAKMFGLQSYLLDQSQTGGVVVDVYGTVIHEIPADAMHNGPVHTHLQVLGPGFAPFKPYLRPCYFYVRIAGLLLFTFLTIVIVSITLLTIPVAIGRFLLSLFGLLNAPEIYTAAVGLYVVWTLTRIILFVVPYAFQGLSSLTAQLLSWMVILLKCVVAGIILFIIIPLGMGFLADMLIFCPLRVPVNKTPVFYPTTLWALGLLHTKCLCGVIWLTNIDFKHTLDAVYQAGIRNINLTFILLKLVWPVICVISLLALSPYIFFVGVLHSLGLMSYGYSIICYRYIFPSSLLLLLAMVVVYTIWAQCNKLYNHVKNEKYLIGRQLVNCTS